MFRYDMKNPEEGEEVSLLFWKPATKILWLIVNYSDRCVDGIEEWPVFGNTDPPQNRFLLFALLLPLSPHSQTFLDIERTIQWQSASWLITGNCLYMEYKLGIRLCENIARTRVNVTAIEISNWEESNNDTSITRGNVIYYFPRLEGLPLLSWEKQFLCLCYFYRTISFFLLLRDIFSSNPGRRIFRYPNDYSAIRSATVWFVINRIRDESSLDLIDTKWWIRCVHYERNKRENWNVDWLLEEEGGGRNNRERNRVVAVIKAASRNLLPTL